GKARPWRGAVRLRLAQCNVTERALPHVVDAHVQELGESVVRLLLGDRGGEECRAGFVPEREGEDAGVGGVRMEAAVIAVAGGDSRQYDGDVRDGDVDCCVSCEVERSALGWPESDAHHLEMKAAAR